MSSSGSNRRFRPTAIEIVVVVLMICLIILVLQPTGNQRHHPAWRCAWKLGEVGKALVRYADAHNGNYPDSLNDLVNGGYVAADLLMCETSHERFVYLGKHLRDTDDGQLILMYEPLGHHVTGESSVLLIDSAYDGEFGGAQCLGDDELRTFLNPSPTRLVFPNANPVWLRLNWIGRGLRAFAREHNGSYPATLDGLDGRYVPHGVLQAPPPTTARGLKSGPPIVSAASFKFLTPGQQRENKSKRAVVLYLDGSPNACALQENGTVRAGDPSEIASKYSFKSPGAATR